MKVYTKEVRTEYGFIRYEVYLDGELLGEARDTVGLLKLQAKAKEFAKRNMKVVKGNGYPATRI